MSRRQGPPISGQRRRDGARLGRLARVGDREFAPIGQHQYPGVAGLAAAVRIEDGAVEPDTARIDRFDGRGAFGEVGVVAKQFFSHGAML
jgi:hypothetical protein